MVRLSERRKELVTSMMQDAVYEAAVAVLTRHGIDGMTMDRVAEEAEVAKGSLYKYFPNKRALLQLIHKKAIDPVAQTVEEIMEAELPALEKLETLLRSWFEYIDEHRGLFRFLFMDDAVRGLLKCEQEAKHEAGMKDLARIVQQGIDEGVFRPIDCKQVAVFLFGAIRGMCEQQVAADASWPVAQSARELTDFFAHGLGVGM